MIPGGVGDGRFAFSSSFPSCSPSSSPSSGGRSSQALVISNGVTPTPPISCRSGFSRSSMKSSSSSSCLCGGRGRRRPGCWRCGGDDDDDGAAAAAAGGGSGGGAGGAGLMGRYGCPCFESGLTRPLSRTGGSRKNANCFLNFHLANLALSSGTLW